MTTSVLPEPVAEALPAPKRSRRRFQFGLRTLLVVMLLAGALGGILARWIALAEHQREVVSKLIDEGMVVHYDTGTPRGQFAKQMADEHYLWQKVDFWHKVVRLEPVTQMTPRKMEAVAQLPDLKELEIIYFPNDKVIPLLPLACRDHIERISMADQPLRPGDLSEIGKCRSLTSLRIAVEKNALGELENIGHLEKLQTLDIKGPLSENAVSQWQPITRLEALFLADTRDVSESTLATLVRRNPSLRFVRLEKLGGRITEICDALSHCQELEQLWLSESDLDDANLAKLRGLPKLAILSIGGTRVRGTAFEGAGSFAALIGLSAAHSPIDDQGVFHVGKLPQLQSLNLMRTRVTDAACQHLSGTKLGMLNLKQTAITDQGIRALHIDTLQDLNLLGTDVSPRPFAVTAQWPSLRTLTFGKRAESEAELEEVLKIPTLSTLNADGPITPEFYRRHRGVFNQMQPAQPFIPDPKSPTT
jgi:hypothetical protein